MGYDAGKRVKGRKVHALVENQNGAVSVLEAGGMDDPPQGQPFGVDQGVDLAPFTLLPAS